MKDQHDGLIKQINLPIIVEIFYRLPRCVCGGGGSTWEQNP